MDFARNLLLKYGWKEGKGLGKQEAGISKPLKPKLKFDTEGFGFDSSEQFTHHWWEHAYDNAANNISVSNTINGDVCVKTLKTNKSTITTKRALASEEHLEYGSFKKRAVLKNTGLIETDMPENEDNVEIKLTEFRNLTDEELYLACGGRTAHKAARHGHNLSGKLERIKNQDQLYSLNKGLLNRNKNMNLDKVQTRHKIHKKHKKDKQGEDSIAVDTISFTDNCRKKDSQNEILQHTEDVLDFHKEKKRKVNKTEKLRKGHFIEDHNSDLNVSYDEANKVHIESKCKENGKEITRCSKSKKKRKHKVDGICEQTEQDFTFNETSNNKDLNIAFETMKVKKKKQK